jgi:phosphopantetheine adenylyltransferase
MAAEEAPRFILFVPPVPSPPTITALKAGFADTLTQVLREVASASTECSPAAILEIALACPHLAGKQDTPRSELYNETQSALAAIYKVICVIAAAEKINVEDADGVDVRVIPVAWSPGRDWFEDEASSEGPVLSIAGLAQANRAWQYAFGVESEAGEAMVRAFVTAKGSGGTVNRLQGNKPVQRDLNPANDPLSSVSRSTASQPTGQRHYNSVVGGTFDHLHIGHKLLLTMTLFAADQATSKQPRSSIIGITGDELLKNKKHMSVLESWSDRQKAVADFCDSLIDFSPASSPAKKQVVTRNDPGPNGKSVDIYYPSGYVLKCTEIQDPFGPTITEEDLGALIISAETRSGGKAVNDKRREKGWKELEVFEVDVLDATEEGTAVGEGFESKLSSTAIREKIERKKREAKV